MAGVAIRVALTGDPAAAFRAARERAEDLRPALRAIGQAVVSQTKTRFITKRAPDGSGWKPSLGNPDTLVRSSLLRDSIHASPPEAGAVEVGSNRIYAAAHQFGATIRAKGDKPLRFRVGKNGGWVAKREVTIPARPFLGLAAEDMAEIEAIALRHLGGPLTGEAA